jgi:PAS domain S-box-containing protein
VFTDDDVNFVRSVANVLAAAIERTESRRAERRQRALFENSPDMIDVLDSNGRLIEVNRRFCEELGYDEDEVLGRPIWEIDPLVDADDVEALLSDFSPDERRKFESRYERRDGSSLPVEVHILRLDIDGEERFLAISRDITERREYEQRFEGALEASPDAVIVVSEDGVIQHANRHVQDILGFGTRELKGMSVEALLVEDDREDHVQFRREYMTSPEPRPMGRGLDLYALHKDGTRIPVEISLGPIEHDGELYVVATISDITARKQREQELRRQNQRLEEFTSVVSHDLRNPLSVIAGRLELVQRECDNEHLEAIEESVERMDVLIENLRRFAREGEVVERVEPIDLSSFAEECWQHIATADATLVTETDDRVRADRGRLQQLLENLMRNAVEHGGEDVTMTVGTTDDVDGFYVEDDGPGIPVDSRAQVFQWGRSTSEENTGIGLAIVDQIAEAHGWQIHLAERPSGGTRFEITGVEFADT